MLILDNLFKRLLHLVMQVGDPRVEEEQLLIAAEPVEIPAESLTLWAGGGGIFVFLQLVFFLLLVLGVLYLLKRILKSWNTPQTETLSQQLRVLSHSVVGGRHRLYFVEIGKDIYLFSSTESTLRLLFPIEDKETQDALRLEASHFPPVPSEKRFSDFIHSILKRSGVASESFPQVSLLGEQSFLNKARGRLQKVQKKPSLRNPPHEKT